MITKVLIIAKTYPSLSNKYGELVCTAGITEDGNLIRIYPIPFRNIEDYEKKYKKYDWIEIDLERNTSDFRPESHRVLDIDSIKVVGNINTENNWQRRKDIIFKSSIYTNMTELIEHSKMDNQKTSLAIFKPKQILSFIIEKIDREWSKNKLDAWKANREQGYLFEDFSTSNKDIVKKLPYKFSYKYIDDKNREATLMIEDWEIGALYWNCLRDANGDEVIACQKVKQKYENFIKENDIYLFLGTTKEWHNLSPNPFIIISVFYPKKEAPSLFD